MELGGLNEVGFERCVVVRTGALRNDVTLPTGGRVIEGVESGSDVIARRAGDGGGGGGLDMS